jgi:hypothetical protein
MPSSVTFSPPKPKFRQLRVFAFDPSLNLELEAATINQLTLNIPWEDLNPGPVGEYLEVVDVDPPSNMFYSPLDLDNKYLLVQDGLSPSEGTPQFHQQMVYAVASRTIANFERALSRPVLWSPREVDGQNVYVPRLRLYPHALREANAYYSPLKKAILFGYFPAPVDKDSKILPGGIVFTCLSHDIISHEVTHALLDGIHPNFNTPSNADVLALHEAFADIVALFQHFSYPLVLHHQIARTRGNLSSDNLLAELAQQFGQALGNRRALRSAIGQKPDPSALPKTLEPHQRGSILVAAVFDAFLTVYNHRIADLLRIATGGTGILNPGAIHPDLVTRMAEEAARIAQHLLTMCIRALDYAPVVDITFGEYLRALITADYDVSPSDPDGYRIALMESFRRYGIYPDNVRSLSEESLLWRPPSAGGEVISLFFSSPTILQQMQNYETTNRSSVLREQVDEEGRSPDLRQRLYESSSTYANLFQDWLKTDLLAYLKSILGMKDDDLAKFEDSLRLVLWNPTPSIVRFPNGLPFKVNSVRLAYRVSQSQYSQPDLVVEVSQARRGYIDPQTQAKVDLGQIPPPPAEFLFRGGVTFLISLESGKVRYVIGKSVTSERRLEALRRYILEGGQVPSLQATYFGDPFRNGLRENAEPFELFALLHRDEMKGGQE